MKRIISIQDISCVGKCSLTTALPIISAAGVEAAVLPTAVLSTHTAFPKFTFKDLTDELEPISETFTELGIGFDAVYTGYLGSFKQLDFVNSFIERFKTKDTTVFIDPVMGDNGGLYTGFTQEFADRMTDLCSKADLITPNMTEASFMLKIPYKEHYTEAYVKDILKALAELGAKRTAITGISFDADNIGVYMYDAVSDEYYSYFNKKFPAVFHGTGDIFAASALGAYMRGNSLLDSLSLAVDYTLECINYTVKDPNHRTYGVNFEEALPMYIERLSKQEEPSCR